MGQQIRGARIEWRGMMMRCRGQAAATCCMLSAAVVLLQCAGCLTHRVQAKPGLDGPQPLDPPGPVRPARPARCLALAWLMGVTTSESMPFLGLYTCTFE